MVAAGREEERVRGEVFFSFLLPSGGRRVMIERGRDPSPEEENK
jgi:prolipoprotein diacylglyceryltransferase